MINHVYNIETKHFWSHFGKANMCLRNVMFFKKNCKQIAETCKEILENWKKYTIFQTQFGFTNIKWIRCESTYRSLDKALLQYTVEKCNL